MPTIKNIKAKPIKNSKGQETIEVSVTTQGGAVGVASVPAGTSTGTHEAHAVPVDQALRIIDELISPKLTGAPVDDQRRIDRKMIAMDGTEQKEYLGGNTILGVSLAIARAAAQTLGQPLYRYLAALAGTKPAMPDPLCVVIEGGKHGTSEKLTFQEFLVGASLPTAEQIYEALAKKLPKATGLEGAFAPDLTNTEALSLLVSTVQELGLVPGDQVRIGIDFAATTLARPPEVSELVELATNQPLGLMEDPLPEEAWHLWAQLKLELKETGKDILLVGDDLFVTNRERLEKGINELIANAILIKPNQIGTVTETLDVIQLARETHFTHVVSHRSGETMDDFIADLAVGTGARYLKAGSPSAAFPERLAKYQRLDQISAELSRGNVKR